MFVSQRRQLIRQINTIIPLQSQLIRLNQRIILSQVNFNITLQEINNFRTEVNFIFENIIEIFINILSNKSKLYHRYRFHLYKIIPEYNNLNDIIQETREIWENSILILNQIINRIN